MKVAHFTNSASPIRNGVASSVNRTCRALHGVGWETVVCANPIHRNMVDATQQMEAGFWGAEDAGVFRSNSDDDQLSYFESIVANFSPDLIHSHFSFSIGNQALKIARKRGIPCIFTFHTDYEIYSRYHLPDSSIVRAVGSKFALVKTRTYCNLSDVVISPSKSFAAYCEGRYRVKVDEVLPTAVPVTRITKLSPRECRAKLGLSNSRRYVGYVGRLGPEKNVVLTAEVFKAAMALEPNLSAVFVGSGTEEEAIRRCLWEEIGSGRVRFLQFEAFEEMSIAYKALDLLVCLSKTETQGLVVSESLAVGCPAIVLNARGLLDSVKHRENGLVLQDDQRDFIASEVLGLIRDPKRLKAYSDAARLDFTNTEEMFGQRLDEIYCNALDSYKSNQGKGKVVFHSLLSNLEAFAKNV